MDEPTPAELEAAQQLYEALGADPMATDFDTSLPGAGEQIVVYPPAAPPSFELGQRIPLRFPDGEEIDMEVIMVAADGQIVFRPVKDA